MALYYLKGSKEGIGKGLGSPLPNLFLFIGILLIIAIAALQALGETWRLEQSLLDHLPAAWKPVPPKTLLLSMDAGDAGFHLMDVALALRGLGKLHSAAILISENIASEQEAMPLLPDLLSQLKGEGIEVIQGESPSEKARYHSIPLCRYDLPNALDPESSWEIIAGSFSNQGAGYFLPGIKMPSDRLQLFALGRQNEVIGSLWWKGLMNAVKSPPGRTLWLLWGRVLLLPNHHPLLLDESGSVEQQTGEGSQEKSCKVVSLDDFLLQIEQKERGTISPGFEQEWDQATVVIGKPSSLPRISTLASLREKISWGRLSLTLQAALLLLWIILLLLLRRERMLIRSLIAILVFLGTVLATGMALRHGILFPFLAPLLFFFLLLMPGGRKTHPALR